MSFAFRWSANVVPSSERGARSWNGHQFVTPTCGRPYMVAPAYPLRRPGTAEGAGPPSRGDSTSRGFNTSSD